MIDLKARLYDIDGTKLAKLSASAHVVVPGKTGTHKDEPGIMVTIYEMGDIYEVCLTRSDLESLLAEVNVKFPEGCAVCHRTDCDYE